MSYDERRNVQEGISFLEEVVLVSLYGNWLITFLDKLDLARSTENRYLPMLQTLCLIIYLMSLFMYFVERIGRSTKLWVIHLITLVSIQVTEWMGSTTTTFKNLTFLFVGVTFWLMIHWVGRIRTRLHL